MGLRVLIGIDNSSFSQQAITFGITLAKQTGATLIGISIVDADSIEMHSASAPLGSFYYAEKLVDEKINEAHAILEKALQDFKTKCQANQVKCETILNAGNPAKEIIKETELADLLIIGIQTFFHFETDSTPDDTFEKIINHSKCPIIAVTEQEIPAKFGVLAAYDGNIKANNAIKAFATINDRFQFTTDVTVLNVNDDLDEGTIIINKAVKYLEAHGLNITGKVLRGRPREIIFKTAKECEQTKKTLLVIGTNGNNELTDLILGNSIKNIILDGTIPLFIYH